MVVVANQTDQTNDGGSPDSTLQNLEANIAAELNPQQPDGSQPDANTADAPPASSNVSGDPQSPEGPAAADAQVADPQAEAAKAQRLSQDNAQLRQTLEKLRIDPDSQTAEHLRSGLVTPEEVLRSRFQPASAPGQPDNTAAPEVPLDQKLINLKNTLAGQKGKDVKADDYIAVQGQMLEVIGGLVEDSQNIQRDSQDRAIQDLQSKNIAATNDVFNKSASVNLPTEVREVAAELVLGATDIAVGKLARQVGQQKALTPQGYAYEAATASGKLNQVVEAAFAAGQKAALDNINPRLNPVNPLQPGARVTPGALPAAKGKYALNNLDANVDAYLKDTQNQVR